MDKDRQPTTSDPIEKLTSVLPERVVLLMRYRYYLNQFSGDSTPGSGPGSPVEFDLWCKGQFLQEKLSNPNKRPFGQDSTKS